METSVVTNQFLISTIRFIFNIFYDRIISFGYSLPDPVEPKAVVALTWSANAHVRYTNVEFHTIHSANIFRLKFNRYVQFLSHS